MNEIRAVVRIATRIVISSIMLRHYNGMVSESPTTRPKPFHSRDLDYFCCQWVCRPMNMGSKQLGMITFVSGEVAFTSCAKSCTSFVMESFQAGAPQYSQWVGKTVEGYPNARISRPV